MFVWMKTIVLVLAVAGFALAQSLPDSSKVQDVAFSNLYVSIEGGEKYPFGDLVDAVDNTFYAGLGVRYTYYLKVQKDLKKATKWNLPEICSLWNWGRDFSPRFTMVSRIL